MASGKSGRRSRKGRAQAAGSRPAPRPAPRPATAPEPRTAPERGTTATAKVAPKVSPQAARPTRRQQREERERAARQRAQANRTLGTYGERPKSVFDPVPVSELAILLGLIAVVVGVLNQGGPALGVGAIVCGFGVLEFSAREHFSGYRSHATLLAAFPAVIVEVVVSLAVGVPKQRALVLVPIIPIFALAFWLLRRSFAQARHNRVTRLS